MKSDIEIANSVVMKDINLVAKKFGLLDSEIETFGKYKAKISKKVSGGCGKLILVTSSSPTKYGEGKTTMSIGINDALNKLGTKSVAVLREPSMGPVFGVKGGATGGGYSQVVPMEDINLHFTGDMHAITSANNLLSAAIDNHIFQGNDLKIKNVLFKRCIDINDRALRSINIGSRKDSFSITAASEIMAILCLSKDIDDLKEKLGNILIGINEEKNPVYASSLKIIDALVILLKDAIKPNLVQSLEGNPVIIHGGPFANIAHGCNSVMATKLGLSLSDYVVTEAGFGSDLGAEKFINIKCQNASIYPDVIVVNTTIRGLKYNGDGKLSEGILNLERHVLNMKNFCDNVVICINNFFTDTKEDIEFIKKHFENLNVKCSVCTSFLSGSEGAIELAKIITEFDNNQKKSFTYDLSETYEDKIRSVAKKIYKASDVFISDDIMEKINFINEINPNLPICIAKTQYSFTDNSKILGAPTDFNLTVKDIYLSNGAGFVVVLLGNIILMPGLNKNPAYENMHIKGDIIEGLF